MKRIMTIIAIAGIAFSSVCAAVYADDNKIKSEIREVQGRIDTVESEVKEFEEQKKLLAEDLLRMNSELQALQDSISELEINIEENLKQLEAAEAKEQASFESFSKRLMTMYENGSNAYIELILGANNLSELINRLDIAREISSHDRDIYQKYKDNKEIIEKKQTELNTEKKELESQNQELDTKLSDKNQEIDEIVSLISDKKSEISELENKSRELNTALGSMDYADALFAEAEKYLGMPYVFGGSTPSTSFDCSGFVCYATTHSGVFNLPRTTAQGIYNQCIKISSSEAKRGDIIFFQGTYNAGETVTHVGFYAGDGKMLHCGNPIQYTSTKTPYWQTHFYAFGRLKK